MEVINLLAKIDLTLTCGLLLGIVLWMKKTGESLPQICWRIREIFSRKDKF